MLSAGHEELTALECITLLPGASDVGANGAFPDSGDAALQQVGSNVSTTVSPTMPMLESMPLTSACFSAAVSRLR